MFVASCNVGCRKGLKYDGLGQAMRGIRGSRMSNGGLYDGYGKRKA